MNFDLANRIFLDHSSSYSSYDKPYFDYRNRRARLVTEGALGRLKIKFRVLFRKCESDKKTVKLYGLACVVPHELCIVVSRRFDFTSDHASNRRLSPEEVSDALALGSTNLRNFEVNKKCQALTVRKALTVRRALTAKMWKEKKDSL